MQITCLPVIGSGVNQSTHCDDSSDCSLVTAQTVAYVLAPHHNASSNRACLEVQVPRFVAVFLNRRTVVARGIQRGTKEYLWPVTSGPPVEAVN